MQDLHFMAKIEGNDGPVSTQDRKQSRIEVEYIAFGIKQSGLSSILIPLGLWVIYIMSLL